MWCDLIDPNHNIFRYNGEGVLMLHDGHWLELPGTSVVERWPYGSDLLTPLEHVTRMDLGSSINSYKDGNLPVV